MEREGFNMMLNRQTLSEQLYEDIKQRIARREIQPGQKLTIRRLQAEYGVSSSPVRDVLLRLLHMGFLRAEDNSSYYVPKMTTEEKKQLLELSEYISDVTLGIIRANDRFDIIEEKLAKGYELFLASEGQPEAARLRCYADALNVLVENCGNPYCEYMVESSQGNFFIAFGDYTGCISVDEAQQNLERLLKAVRERDFEAISREDKYFRRAFLKSLGQEK